MESRSPKLGSEELADVFMYCFITESDRISQANADSAVTVLTQWANLVESFKLQFMFATDQWAKITAKTFVESDLLAEFVMALTVSLQFTLIRKNQDITELANDLADSMMLLDTSDRIHSDWDITSSKYSQRFQDVSVAKAMLAKNRWTLPLVLGALYLPETVRLAKAQDAKPSRKGSVPFPNSHVVGG